MIGFMNALAIIIFVSQSAFGLPGLPPSEFDQFQKCSEKQREYLSFGDSTTWMLLLIVVLTMAVMHFFPRVPIIGKKFPCFTYGAVCGDCLGTCNQ